LEGEREERFSGQKETENTLEGGGSTKASTQETRIIKEPGGANRSEWGKNPGIKKVNNIKKEEYELQIAGQAGGRFFAFRETMKGWFLRVNGKNGNLPRGTNARGGVKKVESGSRVG